MEETVAHVTTFLSIATRAAMVKQTITRIIAQCVKQMPTCETDVLDEQQELGTRTV